MVASVTGNFGASGNSSFIEASEVDMVVNGTFVSSCQLQVSSPGLSGAEVWVPVGAPLTAPGILTYKASSNRRWRIANTWTSGTVYYDLTGSRVITAKAMA